MILSNIEGYPLFEGTMCNALVLYIGALESVLYIEQYSIQSLFIGDSTVHEN